ncbi:Acetylserotonin O-methyltransferase [Galdieria sulphuraria]|nr:Acetylserotonin O-methyltransferase [Galdieria sulphuraria]
MASQDDREQQLQQISRIIHGYTGARTLMTAIQLSVFTHIAQGNHSVEQIARAADANSRGISKLLDALVGMEFLKKDKPNHYELLPCSARFLVKSSPEYVGAMHENDDHWIAWSNLNNVIKTGQPCMTVDQEKKAEEFFPHLVKSLHQMSLGKANRLAEKLLEGRQDVALEVIDIACGSGVWSIPLAEKSNKVRVTAQDFPKILELTKSYVRHHEVDKQFNYLAGDLKTVDLGEQKYDIAILGNIVHSEGEKSSKTLFHKLAQALKPQGKVVVIDMFPNNERTGPAYPLLFALNMLVNTTEGDTFTFEEYRQWFIEANIPHVSMLEVAPEFSVIVAQLA